MDFLRNTAFLTNKTRYFDSTDHKSPRLLSLTLNRIINMKMKEGQTPIVLCIGTDRATGDCLGPLIGHNLSKNPHKPVIFGTLSSPVHAKNLNDTLEQIYDDYASPFILAIDACLGSTGHVGYITLSPFGIKPGEGVSKDLPIVGDVSITGIVNHSLTNSPLILQSTRLNIVMCLADIISDAVEMAFSDDFL